MPVRHRRWSTRTDKGVAALSPLVEGIAYTGVPPSDWSCQPGRAARSAAARQPANPTKHTAAGSSRAQSRSTRARPSRYSRRDSSAARARGPLHEIGRSDAVVAEGMPGVAITGGQTGRDGGGPEPVAGRDEADAGVGGVDARVQPIDEHPQVGADQIRERRGAVGAHPEGALARSARAELEVVQGKPGAAIVEPEDSIFEVLDESIAAGWRIGSVEAVAFRRSPTVEVRSFQPRTFDRWVEGGDRVEWTLGGPATWTAEVPDTSSCRPRRCTGDVIQPPVKPETTRIDLRRKLGERRPKGVKDPGRGIPIDLAELDPRCRRPVPVDDSIGEIDEPPIAPRPSDGCP